MLLYFHMKNTVIVKKMQRCNCCNLRGFFCYTPCGADYITCPCCGNKDFLNYALDKSEHCEEYKKYDLLYNKSAELNQDEWNKELRLSLPYCNNCKIIFGTGCTHSSMGCTDDVMNAHFIKLWRDKTTNVVYEGMPEFENENEWFSNANNIEILKWFCPHNGANCSNTQYKIEYGCSLK